MQARRVLVLTSTYPRYAGDAAVPPFVHELTRRLVGAFEMHVLAPHAPGSAIEEEVDGVQVHRFRYLPERFETLAYGGGMLPGLRRRPWRLAGLPLLLWAEYQAARRLLAAGGFGLIHAHWAIPHGYIGAKLKGERALLCTSHGSDLFALDTAWARPFKRLALVRADAVTVVSEALRAKAGSIMPGMPAEVMPMGVDMGRFTPPSGAQRRDGLLYVGRLVEDKGVQILLRALTDPRLAAHRPRLRIVGNGTAETSLRILARELGLEGQVDFLGALPNERLPELYRGAEALIFPSLLGKRGEQEGMGLVPVEALACGCPVIASRLPAVSEVIQDGKTGLLFRPGDAAELAGCIMRFQREPELARLTSVEGCRQVKAKYDWANVAGAYRTLYDKLIRLPKV